MASQEESFMSDAEFQEFSDAVETTINAPKPYSRVPGDYILKTATEIFNKIDVEGTGVVEKAQMRAYCERIISFINPGAAVDEEALDKGFRQLDKDRDGKVTLYDMMQQVAADMKSSQQPTQIPQSFELYRMSTRKSSQTSLV